MHNCLYCGEPCYRTFCSNGCEADYEREHGEAVTHAVKQTTRRETDIVTQHIRRAAKMDKRVSDQTKSLTKGSRR